MKKYMLSALVVTVTTVATWASNTTPTIPTPYEIAIKMVSLKAGTLVFLELDEKLYSDEVTIGKSVRFKVRTNVMAEGKVVITTGSLAIGRVKNVKAQTYNNPAEVTIELTYVQAVDGQQVALNGTEQVIKGQFPSQGTEINAGTSITANVMNDIDIEVKNN